MVTGVIGKVAGVVDAYQHSVEGYDRFQSGDYSGAAISAAKFGLDVFFIFAKANPVVLGASVAWAAYNTYEDIQELNR